MIDGDRGPARAHAGIAHAAVLSASAEHMPARHVIVGSVYLKITIAGFSPDDKQAGVRNGKAGFYGESGVTTHPSAIGGTGKGHPATDIPGVTRQGWWRPGIQSAKRFHAGRRRFLRHTKAGIVIRGAEIHQVTVSAAHLGHCKAGVSLDEIVFALSVKEIVAAVAEQPILTRARLVAVGAEITVEIVNRVIVSRPTGTVAVEGVMIGPAHQQVDAGSSFDSIIAAAAFHPIVPGTGINDVIPAVSEDRVLTRPAGDVIGAVIRTVNDIVTVVSGECIPCASAAMQLIHAGTAADLIRPGPAVKIIVTGITAQ